ncbi:MAG: type II toxin-antitoxin system VapC family toxin [Chloroflexi bacterium]|nr:type II toxin-antitoxin system VapC family toxin [Chloroflexota bacterium]
MVLLDTDVMVDLLREHVPAVRWLDSLDEEILLPGFVVMELIQGCASRAEQRRLQKALAGYRVIWPSPEMCDEAISVFAQHHLSHSLGIIDAPIGQLAISLELPLQTFNHKHYSAIPNLRLEQPYSRS